MREIESVCMRVRVFMSVREIAIKSEVVRDDSMIILYFDLYSS